jgi:GTP pyrophosphokinase
VVEDRVYVFTPNGEVVDLTKGATPLDFAYHIHTEIGHRCRGAKVNGRMVPLTYTLQTGERVEVLTAKQGTPSRDWLNPNLGYLQTSRARSKVHHWFRLQDRDKNVAAGRACMDRELQRLGLKSLHYDELAGKLNFKTGEDLLAAVGAGDVRPSQVLGAMQSPLTPSREAAESVPVSRRQETGRAPDVYVQGVGNLLTQMAGCCKPVPGDAIVGYITRGRGVTIHRRDCRNVLRFQDSARERLIEVDWGQAGGTAYLVDVYIRAYDRRGLLRDITAILANDKINVIAINSLTDKHDNTADITLTLEITGLTQLGRVLAQINQLQNVMEVHRRQ